MLITFDGHPFHTMTSKEFFEKFKAILETQYPTGAIYKSKIPKHKQDEHITALKSTIPYEQFFFVLNLESKKIEHAHGIDQWLGYKTASFDIYKYFSVIHPSHYLSLTNLASSSFAVANSGTYKVMFMNHRVVVQLPIKHSDGTYKLFKRTLYPFQIDVNGKVIAYLNHFVLLRDYHEEDSLAMRVSRNTRIVSPLEHNSVKDDQVSSLHKYGKLPFNDNHMKFLKCIADNPDATNKELAVMCGVSETTVDKSWNTRINKMAKAFFGKARFGEGNGVKYVAFFMRNEGLL